MENLSDKKIETENNQRIYPKWILFCSFGEILGIAIAALIARLIWLLIGEPAGVMEKVFVLVVMIFAGALEGLSVGYFQWRVLRLIFEKMSAITWIRPTVLVAALGWFLGTIPSIFFVVGDEAGTTQNQPDLPLVWTMVFAAVLGLIVGAIFGFAQWTVLKKFAEKA